ncbi:hypothetical protein HYDPIDRAFT_104521 [Hydnomerulius pinastri MD-312]|nr:hypothetical protein HYDPIDRAFT_104521 [Hydnomerulius pinastri MD-312]
MDFETYSSYANSSPAFSDSSSTPRTPSPRSADLIPSINYKHSIESVPQIFQESESYLHSEPPMIQNEAWSSPPQYSYSHPRGSLLQELYEPDVSEQYQNDVYIDDHAHYTEWQQQQQQQMHVRQSGQDHTVVRRATFPYVRHDQLPQHLPHHHAQFYDQYPSMYNEPLPISPDPSEHHHSHHPHDPQAIKLEDTPLIVPSQLGFSSHPLHAHHHPAFLPSSAGGAVPIQHTDDAASKETQYLRRRCFNCHTTEPPSWRRSTLNPGKIVCNKCGLYERTHLRPRPLRFDELRAGGKTRKAGGSQGEKKGPKAPAAVGSPQVKKEPREFGLVRRGSVSSNASSGGGVSDWDDNVSVYSSQPPTPGSASGQSSSFSSPAVATFPIPRSSQSPPVESGAQGPIRLPNAPLSDIASLQQQAHPAPRKSATAPNYYPQPAMYQGQQDSFRRGSLPVQRNVQFASPPMSSQSPAPMQGLAPEASLQASPLMHASPQLLSSPSLAAEAPSS